MGNVCDCNTEDYAANDNDSQMPKAGAVAAAIPASSPVKATPTPTPTPSQSCAKSESATPNTYFHVVPDVKEEKEAMKEFDLNSPVFKGTVVDQKFSNKSSYDQKFMWINIDSKTLNLSEYRTKEKRHKEASLADVVNVVAGPPEKFKAPIDQSTGEPMKLNIACCMSVTFVRGGGIDLKFSTEAERDAWYAAVTKLMVHQRAVEVKQ